MKLTSGPDKGGTATLRLGETRSDPELSLGQRVRVFRNPNPGAAASGTSVDRYTFQDFDRRRPMLWLALAFAALVIVTGRGRGIRALIGLGLSLVIVSGVVNDRALRGQQVSAEIYAVTPAPRTFGTPVSMSICRVCSR